jgi:2-polyprenyl-6-methoxyphenol hydroxylase-like FAD-dependent oxidoreductase
VTKVLVVGGGISGLTTALVLSRQEMTVDLVERDQQILVPDYGITLNGPALRALEKLELLDECQQQGYTCNERVMYDSNGQILRRIATSAPNTMDVAADKRGVLGTTRRDLHQALTARVEREQVNVRTGQFPTGLVERPRSTSVIFSDDTHIDYDLVVAADGLRSTTRDLSHGPLIPTFRELAYIHADLPRHAEVSTEVCFTGHPTTRVDFTPTSADTMYLSCVIPTADPISPRQSELPELLRTYLAPFGGIAAWAREQIHDPDLLTYTLSETILVAAPWSHGHTVLVGDAAHCATPDIAAGIALCLEDAIVLGEELMSTDDTPQALDAYSRRRYNRCKYVVETSVTLSNWQTHPNVPYANQEGLRAQASAFLNQRF